MVSPLCGQEKTKILFDEHYARWKPSSQLYDLSAELQKKGYSVEYSKDWMDSLSPSEYDVLVLFIPFRYFHDDERETIKEFVKNGGGLMIFGEHGGYMDYRDILSSINSVSTMFGIEFIGDVVLDEEKNREDEECHPIFSTFTSHPVTKGVKNMVYICGCSLTVKSPAKPLVYGNRTTTTEEKKGKDIVVLAAAEYGKGRVLAMGDTDFLCSSNTPGYDTDYLFLEDNKTLVLNMFEWAASPENDGGDDTANEGYELFSQRKYSEAKSKFEEALEGYLEANNSQKAADMRKMIDRCDAEVAYLRGMDYYNKGDYDNAKTEFETSKNLYDQAGDSAGSGEVQEMADLCDRYIKARDAEAAYQRGEEHYEKGEYESAKTEFEASKSLYDEIEDSDSSRDAQSKVNLCDQYMSARDMYGTGEDYNSKEQYEEALAKFREAQTLYEELKDTEKVGELENRINETQKAIDDRDARNRMLILIGIVIVVAVVSLLVVVFLRRPSISKKPGVLPGEPVYCPHCGKENLEDASYCEHCGKPLTSIDELEKEEAFKALREKYVKGEISEEEYHKAMKKLEEGL